MTDPTKDSWDFYKIETVEPYGNEKGWTITVDGSMCMGLSAEYSVTPKVGDRIGFCPRSSFGSRIRGVSLNGVILYHRTEAEESDRLANELYPDVRESVRRWDAGDSVHTVEMGGIGPGYEQCIQMLVFEILRDYLEQPLPEKDEEWPSFGNDAVARLNRLGFSGAQVGAAKNLAAIVLRKGGWRPVMEDDAIKDRRILVSKNFPQP